MTTFIEAKAQFDTGPGNSRVLPISLVPVDGKPKTDMEIRNAQGKPLEEYYKSQFIYALLYSGSYPKDYIGVEVRFPKGSPSSAPLKIDGAIFDSADWLQHYQDYWASHWSGDL